MEQSKILELQPLFCTRASLLQAQEMLEQNAELDCQLRLRFVNGYEIPLKVKRTDIETLIDIEKTATEKKIEDALSNNSSQSKD